MASKTPSLVDRFGRPLVESSQQLVWPDRRAALGSALRELPVFPTSTSFDSVAVVRSALRDFEGGYLTKAAELCDAFGNDDRIKGVLDTRVDALFGLQREILPRGSEPAAKRLTDLWPDMYPAEELKSFLRWGLLLRVAFGRWEPYQRQPGEWRFRFRSWDPRWCRFDWETRSFRTQVDGGDEVEVTPGLNGWVVYAPDGLQRGWMNGLVRSLALLYVTRRWAFRDWARESEAHGMPIRAAYVPTNALEEDKKAFFESVKRIGNEAVFRLAKDEDGKGFDLKLIEAAAQSWQGFERLIAKSDECIAVDVLGQTLTTTTEGKGSNALGKVHDSVRQDRLEGDAQSLGPCLREQTLRPWAAANYGDPELAPEMGWETNTNVSVDPATGLNGAQVTALLEVVKSVARGELPRETGVHMIVASFPVTVEQAEQLMGEVGRGFKPTTPPAPTKPLPPARDPGTGG